MAGVGGYPARGLAALLAVAALLAQLAFAGRAPAVASLAHDPGLICSTSGLIPLAPAEPGGGEPRHQHCLLCGAATAFTPPPSPAPATSLGASGPARLLTSPPTSPRAAGSWARPPGTGPPPLA